MIYIFDDNRFGQMSLNYQVDYLKELPKYNFVTHFQKHSRNTEGYGFLENAIAVFIHDSFPNGDNYSDSEHKKEIVARAINLKIPYVIFSNQFAVTVFDAVNVNSIKSIKKDRFYHNLMSFLDDYSLTKEFKREKLAIGKNYEVEKTYIIEDRLSSFLLERKLNFNYDSDIRVDNEYGKDIIELFYFLYSDVDGKEFLKFHEKCRNENISTQNLKKNIKDLVNKIIIKYED
jgi:hypothetical protein